MVSVGCSPRGPDIGRRERRDPQAPNPKLLVAAGIAVQVVPLKCRASGLPVTLLAPKAQTSVLESAAIVLTNTFVKAGLETTLQRVPSQCSTKASGEPKVFPTTHALFEAGAVTPVRELFFGSFGLAMMLQLVPFQWAINGVGESLTLICLPTAHTSLLADPATATNGSLTAGVGTTLQLVPSKCSASVVLVPLLLRTSPTAQMSL
jgi:hypothetical protein